MTLEIDALKEENKKLKFEMRHLMSGFERFTKCHNLQSELLMNTVMKNDKCGIGFKIYEEKKTQANV